MCKPLFTPPQALHKSAEPSSAPGSRGPQGPIPQPKTPVPHLLPIIQAPGPARGQRLLPLTSSEGPDRAGPGGGHGGRQEGTFGAGGRRGWSEWSWGVGEGPARPRGGGLWELQAQPLQPIPHQPAARLGGACTVAGAAQLAGGDLSLEPGQHRLLVLLHPVDVGTSPLQRLLQCPRPRSKANVLVVCLELLQLPGRRGAGAGMGCTNSPHSTLAPLRQPLAAPKQPRTGMEAG